MPRKKRPVKIYTLDTETIGLDGAIKRIAIYDGNNVTYGYNFSDVEHVLIEGYKQGFKVYCYIHNLEFDARKIDNLFIKGKILWSQCKLINGRYAKIVTGKYTFLDSFKLLPRALSVLSKSFDLEHGKLDLWEEVQQIYPDQYKDHVDFLSRCDPDDPLYMKYLGYDVMSLYELIDKLCDVAGITHDVIVNLLTTASLSRYIFKNGYKGQLFKDPNRTLTDFEILCSNKAWGSEKHIKSSSVEISYIDLENFIRKGYHGGRTEVFKSYAEYRDGETVAYYYDVNSEYPAVMKNRMNVSGVEIGNIFPVGYPDYYADEYMSKYTWEKYLHNRQGLGFLDVTVYVPKQDIPPLPVKMQKLVFPCGYIRGVFTYAELEYAIKNCGVEILEYHSCCHFSKTFNVFERFISVFSEIKSDAKATGQKALEQFSKDVQNVGYGWTALNRDDKTELNYIEKAEDYGDRLLYTNEELGYCEAFAIVRAKTIQVQVAAYVTSYARLLLLDTAREQATKGHVYYCDTDSLVCEKPLSPEKVHKTKLGFWDLEREITEAVFVQPKVYAINENVVKFKGVSKNRQKDLNMQFYKELLQDLIDGREHYKIVEEDIERLRSIRVSHKKHLDPNELEHLNKRINLFNKQKRQMFYDENYSLPWYFEDLTAFENFNFDVDYTPYLNEEGNLMDFARGVTK